MKKLSKLLLLSLFGLVFDFVQAPVPQAQAAMSNWQKGASIQSSWNGDFGSDNFKQSVNNLAATHANYVALVFRIYQSNLYSTDIQNGNDTPTDAALASAIDYVHSKGMHVLLKPHLESWSGDWRAYINPGDRTTWFNNYTNMMKHFAQIGQAHGAEDFCVGTELIDMSTASANGGNTQAWRNVIAAVRGVFSGKLTYGANWGPKWSFPDEKDNIQFWDALDYIGISAYYNFNGDNSTANLESQWNNYNQSDIGPLSQQWNKPVVFTEVGYISASGAHNQPWNPWYSGNYDGNEQAQDYTALFDYWQNQGFMTGVEMWDWKTDPNGGWPGDTGYTPQHKPAQDVMTQYFGASGGSGNPPPPSGNATFSSTGSASPGTVSSGQAVNIAVNVKDNSGSASGIIVDAEVYNSGGGRVMQKVFDNQTFAGGQTQTYNFSYTPSTNDTFKVKVGVFNSNWSQLYNWNDNVASFNSTSSGGGNPPPGNTSINVWWPTNGANVSGTQPFKGNVNGMDVSQYNMYWQVDGGGLVQMANNNADYPHKEALVDLSGWKWKGNGPYHVNFVAKDMSGNMIAQQAVDIYVY